MWAPNGYHHPIRIGKSICILFFNICNTQQISCFMLNWNIGTVHFFQRITSSKNCSSLWFLFLRLHSSLLGINSVRKVYQHVTSGLAWGFMFHVHCLGHLCVKQDKTIWFHKKFNCTVATITVPMQNLLSWNK